MTVQEAAQHFNGPFPVICQPKVLAQMDIIFVTITTTEGCKNFPLFILTVLYSGTVSLLRNVCLFISTIRPVRMFMPIPTCSIAALIKKHQK